MVTTIQTQSEDTLIHKLGFNLQVGFFTDLIYSCFYENDETTFALLFQILHTFDLWIFYKMFNKNWIL